MNVRNKFLLKIKISLILIAKTLLEVETLDAEQINHLYDHGRLPESSNIFR